MYRPIYSTSLYDTSESQSRPLIPPSLRLLRSDIKARALSEETSHGENVVYTTTFVSLAPAVARTPRYSLSLSLSPPMVVSFVFAQGSSGAPIESTPVTRSNGGCRNNSSMSIYVEGRMVGNNESGTNYQNNEGKKRRKVSRTD